ncbi:Cyanovirin-N [Annulohypoxylon truncatum]|uniref:Cyanovirin-N n=1 Tax=Annulohypoxylon truncatum TaxID=327061 RepID=UPI002007711E|nr:Cyanovirin-N [Annulohypoxylon truncatum]KAI1207915.1 Cyanovirin-N [Annulohypoxylon truncatum]
MAFSLTSKQVELRGSWLAAILQKDDGSWTFSKLNLNEHVGNNDGSFDVTIDKWYNSAEHWSCHLQGPFLRAQLKTREGAWAPETSVNLDLFIRNKDGSLEFQKLNDSLLFYTASLQLEYAILRGLVVGPDGKLYLSELNLDENIGNINGKFEAGERHYSRSGRDFKLEQGLDSVKLSAELADYAGAHHPAEIDLAEIVVNRNGKLSFLRPYVYSPTILAMKMPPLQIPTLKSCASTVLSYAIRKYTTWNEPGLTVSSSEENSSKDNWAAAIAEQIPLVGSAIAGLHRVTDEKESERLYRNIAASTNSATVTIGTVLGAFIGRAIRGPVIGMVLGAGLSTTPGVFLEERIAASIEDAEVRSQIQQATLGRYIFETLREMIAADQTVAAAQLLDAALSPEIDNWKKNFVFWLEKQEITLLGDFSLHATLKRVFARLRNEHVVEWDLALDQLAAITARTSALKLEPEPEPEPEAVPSILVEAPAADQFQAVEAAQQAQVTDESKAATDPAAQTTNESEALDSTAANAAGKPTSSGADEPPQSPTATAVEPNENSGSSTRASSLKPSAATAGHHDAGNGGNGGANGAAGNGNNGNKSTTSVSRTGSSRKGWHNVLGITMFRSWSRHRQPKAVAV